MIYRYNNFISKLSLKFLICSITMGEDLTLSEIYKESSKKIISAAHENELGYQRMEEICYRFGPRLSGSNNLELALDWITEEMIKDGFNHVYSDSVIVSKWVRGNEQIRLTHPWEKDMAMLGLGQSIGTPKNGISGEVMVVSDFAELDSLNYRIEGKIVLFDVPFTTYGETVKYRYKGADTASKYGALASMIRSIGDFSMNTPHTGGMSYSGEAKKIPHSAITIEDAKLLHWLYNNELKPRVEIIMNAQTLDSVYSRNLICELTGREKPHEIVVLGGHIDSWDTGLGAHDDAGGCVAAWEAVRIIKELGLRPRRTLRVVLWTNEENGLMGAKSYRKKYLNELENHVAAMESDNGVFAPIGIGFTGSDEARLMLNEIVKLLSPINADSVLASGREADIGPLEKDGVPLLSLEVNRDRYFWLHHTPADTPEKVDKDEFRNCIASFAVMAYILADMKNPLTRIVN